VAVGDLADRPDGAALLQQIRPSFATIDVSTPGRSTSDAVIRYAETAQRLGVELIATGLDSPSRSAEALALGATFGRGVALGVPGALPS
jgi:hypothetical protein